MVIILYTIKENSTYQIEIKNSKFICCLFKINDKSEINNILNNIKNNYKDATHYCYAYITENSRKSSDDGEPSGTAGIPILTTLQNNNLTNVLAVVIRYFGGIKLGAGGLVRAYTKSVKEALNNNIIIKIEKGINVDIFFSYDKTKDINYLLKDITINNKVYDKIIKYNINISHNKLNEIKDILDDYKINNDIYIENSDLL